MVAPRIYGALFYVATLSTLWSVLSKSLEQLYLLCYIDFHLIFKRFYSLNSHAVHHYNKPILFIVQ